MAPCRRLPWWACLQSVNCVSCLRRHWWIHPNARLVLCARAWRCSAVVGPSLDFRCVMPISPRKGNALRQATPASMGLSLARCLRGWYLNCCRSCRRRAVPRRESPPFESAVRNQRSVSLHVLGRFNEHDPPGDGLPLPAERRCIAELRVVAECRRHAPRAARLLARVVLLGLLLRAGTCFS